MDLTRLVVVSCHAVHVAGDLDRYLEDSSWALEPFQRGEPRVFVEHIRRGVELAHADPRALLVFSGGMTRRDAGRLSEAEGYLRIARHLSWWSMGGVGDRAASETFARDSFENLLFSICRFREVTGGYPEAIAAVSWAFKRARFELHARALRYERFTFEAVGQPDDLDAAIEGERTRGIGPFSEDPYGRGDLLSRKRRERDPFGSRPPYGTTCPEIAGLIAHAGPGIYDGPLPWT